eukprot:scaffold5951_cov63-Phaeocystis_antarctica.AAC.2
MHLMYHVTPPRYLVISPPGARGRVLRRGRLPGRHRYPQGASRSASRKVSCTVAHGACRVGAWRMHCDA